MVMIKLVDGGFFLTLLSVVLMGSFILFYPFRDLLFMKCVFSFTFKRMQAGSF